MQNKFTFFGGQTKCTPTAHNVSQTSFQGVEFENEFMHSNTSHHCQPPTTSATRLFKALNLKNKASNGIRFTHIAVNLIQEDINKDQLAP